MKGTYMYPLVFTGFLRYLENEGKVKKTENDFPAGNTFGKMKNQGNS